MKISLYFNVSTLLLLCPVLSFSFPSQTSKQAFARILPVFVLLLPCSPILGLDGICINRHPPFVTYIVPFSPSDLLRRLKCMDTSTN